MENSDAMRRENVFLRLPHLSCPRMRGIQYAAAFRLKHVGLLNTGLPGPVYAKASTRPQTQGRAAALAKAASGATTAERAVV